LVLVLATPTDEAALGVAPNIQLCTQPRLVQPLLLWLPAAPPLALLLLLLLLQWGRAVPQLLVVLLLLHSKCCWGAWCQDQLMCGTQSNHHFLRHTCNIGAAV
jgi:hypothetical protein